MSMHPWHPYAPDQAFGWQAARDEELLDAVIARLENRRSHRVLPTGPRL